MGSFVGRFAEAMNWWKNKPEPKPIRQTFYNRIASGYSKEEAILVGKEWDSVVKERSVLWINKKYKPTYSSQSIEKKKETTGINITYPKEIADIFRREFEDIIDRLEWNLRNTYDREGIKEIYDKIEFAKSEREIFNLYNPIQNENT